MPKEYSYESEIKCPHCDHEFSDSWEYNGESDCEVECTSCQKDFYLSVDTTVDYSTRVLNCKDDKHEWHMGNYSDIDRRTLERWSKDSVMFRHKTGKEDPYWLWRRECRHCTEAEYEQTEPRSKTPWEEDGEKENT